MTPASQVLAAALGYKGTVEDPYGSNRTPFGASYGWNGVPWCDIFIAEIGKQVSGSYDLLGKFAWTPSHAQWFAKDGRFGSEPRPGALVFFDWSGGKSIGGIDHVGIVIRPNAHGGCDTIEGNASIDGHPDGVWLHARGPEFIVGYGYPDYQDDAVDAAGPMIHLPPPAPAAVTHPAFRPWQAVKAGSRTIRLLDSGDDVKVMQRAVGATTDGQFGALTKNAVQAYQKARRLTVDGICGPNTWSWILNGRVGHLTPPTVSTPALPYLMRNGSSGAGVRALQSRLVARGWRMAIDGKFGPATEAVIRKFQHEKGITVDGEVGVMTWQMLWRSPIT